MVITADESSDTSLNAFHSGADDILAKPLNKDQLFARLKSASRVVELENQLLSQTRNDPLTGLATKRYLEEQLQREWERALHYRAALSCILLDVDSFGKINEEVGIAAGDQVVEAVAEILKSNTRVTDYVCRLEGDRFLIIQTESNENQMIEFSERLRKLIADSEIQVAEKTLNITVSIGVSLAMSDTQNLDQLISLTEESLVIAKRLKGNRVISQSSLNVKETEELSKVIGQNPLMMTQARDIMSEKVDCLRESFTAREASDFLIEHGINSAPVVDDEGKLVGILSEKDILKCILYQNKWDQPISSLISRNVVSFEESESAEVIYNFLLKAAIRRVIIVKDGRPTGVISRGSLLRWFCEVNNMVDHNEEAIQNDEHQIGLMEYLKGMQEMIDPALDPKPEPEALNQ